VTSTETDDDVEVRDRSDADRWPDVEVRGYITPDLEILSRARGGDGRTMYGIVVPYGKRQRIHDGLEEMFRMGAAAHQVRTPQRMKLAREHIKLGGILIGRATELREDTAGLVAHLRASKTDAGDETLTLVEDGALDELSVGFHAVRDKVHKDGLIERVRVNILETAVVIQGAYGRGARVQGLRSTDGVTEDDTTQDDSGTDSATQDDTTQDSTTQSVDESKPIGPDLAMLRAQAARSRSRIVIVRGMIR
jgi:HK97 family phage prohead protease